jgi:hypothetical protein
MKRKDKAMEKPYAAPAITQIASLHELTLDPGDIAKDIFPKSDGYTFRGDNLNVS